MLIIDQQSVKISLVKDGANAGVHVGTDHALLHCTKNANLAAGDVTPPDEVNNGPAINIEGRVFIRSTENERDLGNLEFGLVQVSFLHGYEFIYAGRLESEGSTVINLRLGYSKNPSLDEETARGRTIDQEIFRSTAMTVTPVRTGKTGFDVLVKFSDHPNNAIPLRFENRVTSAPNFLASAARNEEFITYFVARVRNVEPISILARIGWTVNWKSEFNWSAATMKPIKDIRASFLFAGDPRIGPPDASDPMAAVALARQVPTTNAQDSNAQDAAWTQRRQPICEQNRARPINFRSNFFT